MALQAISLIKSWFLTGKKPTQAQFNDVFDSYLHKSENIPLSKVDGLVDILDDIPSDTAFNNHVNDVLNPHGVTKAQVGLGNVVNLDTSNPANISQSALYRFATDTEKTTWNGKQNALTFDETPTDSSNNPVKSNGVFDALIGKVDKVTGKGLSENDFTSAEKTKLSNLSEHYVGRFTSLGALATAYPTGIDGQYATIDTGASSDSRNAIWDTNDNQWVISSGSGNVLSVNGQTGAVSLSTDNIGEGATNQYFTAQRVRDALLTAISFAIGTAITAGDSVLVALGKLQKQITDHKADTANPHGVTKAQVGLGNVPDVDTTNPANISQSALYRFVTDTEKENYVTRDEANEIAKKAAIIFQ